MMGTKGGNERKDLYRIESFEEERFFGNLG